MRVFRQAQLPVIREARGDICRIIDDGTPFQAVLVITSKAGTVRSNHYHKQDAHYCYVLSGRAEWHEQPVGGGPVETAVLEPGDLVYTPPMTVHAVKFLQDSVLLAVSRLSRNQPDYEADTVRVTLIDG